MNNLMDEYIKDSDIAMLTKHGPQQVDFMSLVHNFTPEKVFKVDLRTFAKNHRLVPFSGDTFGLYQMDGYSPFNEKTGNLNDDYQGDSHDLGLPLFIVKFNRAVYAAAKDMHTNYWTWKKNRNEKRSALEEEHGYDTKHAMHLVRLLRTGAEALQTGTILVRRPDAEELLAIRNGAWTYDELIKYAEDLDKQVREDLYAKTSLPKRPDMQFAAELMIQVQDMVWNERK